jgi:uncharacterized protein (DUF1778 family)
VVAAAHGAARHAIAETEIIRPSRADQQPIAESLASLARPKAALRRAFARHEKLFGRR